MEGGTLTEKSEAPLFPCDLSSSLWDGGPTSCAVIVHGLAARSRTGRYTTEKNGAHARHRTALAKKKRHGCLEICRARWRSTRYHRPEHPRMA